MKVAIYARVSTTEQTVDNQLPALEAYCKAKGYEVGEIYQEQESAWKAGHQKELSRLLTDLRSGKKKFDIVLVWALDRLTRGGSAAILNLVTSFKAYGSKVISLQESWTELPGELGEVLYAIAGWVARMESQRRSERVRAAHERVRESGKHIGRPKGKIDGKPRKTTGYLLRYATKKLESQ